MARGPLVLTGVTGAVLGVLVGRRSTGAERRRLRLAAVTDPLTGLPNRAGLVAAHSALHARGGSVVAVVDVDDFKAVNDTCGHHVGDLVLVAVADRLRWLAGSLGGTAARLSGDEFVLVAPVAAAPGLARTADLALREITYVGPAGPVGVTVSVGLALGGPGDRLADLLATADLRMYARKGRRPGRSTSGSGRRTRSEGPALCRPGPGVLPQPGARAAPRL